MEDTIWNYQQVAEAYRVRWNIEILFKSWKSGFHMAAIIPEARTRTARVESILYMLLLYIAWFQMLVYVPLRWHLYKMKKYLSLIRAAKWIIDNTMQWINGVITMTMKHQITYYCCYDSRKDRINAAMQLEQLFYDFP